MKKLVLLVAALALIIAACGGGGNAVAATVNGSDITVDEVESLIAVEGSTIDKATFAQFLGFEIQWQIVEQAAQDEYGIEVTEGEIDAEADRIYESGNQGESREEFTANRGVSEQFLRNLATQQIIDVQIREAFTEDAPRPSQEDIDAEAEIAAASLTEVCVSHILVATAEEADSVVDRLDGGEDFAAIAEEVSTDPGSAANGGELPCGSAGQYVAEFRDASLVAPLNEVYSEIVESQFGFHIMLVTDRTEPSPEDLPTEQEVIDTIIAASIGEDLNAWFVDLISSAEVDVDAEFGTWVTDPSPGVTPPAT